MAVSMVKTRKRVQHKEYEWLGEIDTATALPDGWFPCKWDNGTASTEHIDDLIVR